MDLDKNICDLFYADSHLVVITRLKGPSIQYIEHELTPFQSYKCPHELSIVYYLKTEYRKKVSLLIEGCVFEYNVNLYPKFPDEIIFSTLVKDEDEFIIPWIEYHLRMGVTRFIIYDNSDRGTLEGLLEDYIHKHMVTLIRWNIPYGNGCQQCQQNHSIYAFRDSKYIGFFDIDEYVNLQSKTTIPHFLEKLIQENQLDTSKIGSFRLLSKPFYNPNNLSCDDGKFLSIFNCDSVIEGGCEKNFVLPRHVDTFSCHMITSGKEMYHVPKELAIFNHYMYLNKIDRGRNSTSLEDRSILIHLNDFSGK
jgi:hypothetical protein